MDLIRDGRKHFAAVWAFSQLATDLTGESDTDDIDALLGYRVVFRQSAQTAVDALRFLGSDGRDDNVETVTSLGTGECLMRDPSGRLGLIRIAVPDDPAVADAFSTTPGANRRDGRPVAVPQRGRRRLPTRRRRDHTMNGIPDKRLPGTQPHLDAGRVDVDRRAAAQHPRRHRGGLGGPGRTPRPATPRLVSSWVRICTRRRTTRPMTAAGSSGSAATTSAAPTTGSWAMSAASPSAPPPT